LLHGKLRSPDGAIACHARRNERHPALAGCNLDHEYRGDACLLAASRQSGCRHHGATVGLIDVVELIPTVMREEDFEWDEAKAIQNYAQHRVSFETAKRVFEDRFGVERLDDRVDYGEDRYSIIGMVDRRVLSVAFTLRNGRIRIISARAAEPAERRNYHERRK